MIAHIGSVHYSHIVPHVLRLGRDSRQLVQRRRGLTAQWTWEREHVLLVPVQADTAVVQQVATVQLHYTLTGLEIAYADGASAVVVAAGKERRVMAGNRVECEEAREDVRSARGAFRVCFVVVEVFDLVVEITN